MGYIYLANSQIELSISTDWRQYWLFYSRNINDAGIPRFKERVNAVLRRHGFSSICYGNCSGGSQVDCRSTTWYKTSLILMSTDLTRSHFAGAPRYLDTDDIYDGDLIPGGSIVIMNIWSVLCL